MSGAIGSGGEWVSIREFLRWFMAPGIHIPHGPLFLDLGGEGCSQHWLEMCHNYSLPHGSRVSIIIPKGGGSFAPRFVCYFPREVIHGSGGRIAFP